jgi:hypothetical protein
MRWELRVRVTAPGGVVAFSKREVRNEKKLACTTSGKRKNVIGAATTNSL